MKKISYLILMLVFSFLLVGCDISFGKKPAPNPDDNGGGGGEVKPDRPDKPELDYDFFVEKYEFTVLKEKQTLLVKVDHNDGIFILDLIRSKGCKIEGFYFDYELGKRIQDYEIKVQEGMPIFMNVNVDSTGKFDVWVIDFIFGELPNPDPNPGPDIPNIEFKDHVKLGEWQTVYKLNEPFAGGTLIHVFEGLDYKYETIIIIESMLSGFDTSKAGDKTVKIKYNGTIIEAPITVLPSIDPTIPTTPINQIKPTNLNRDEVSKMVATFFAIIDSYEIKGNEFDRYYNIYINDNELIDGVLEASQKLGLTSDQLKKLNGNLINDFGPKYQKNFAQVTNKDDGFTLFEVILTTDIKDSIKALVNILTDVQTFAIVPAIFNDGNLIVDGCNPQLSTSKHLTFPEIIKNIENLDKSLKDAFNKQYTLGKQKLTYTELLTNKEVRYTAKLFKEVVTDLLNAKGTDIKNVINMFIGPSYSNEYDKYIFDLKLGFNSLETILKLTSKDSLINVAKLIINNTIKADFVQYDKLETIKENLETGYNSILLINKVLQSINDNDYKQMSTSLAYLINNGDINEDVVNGLIILSKPLMKEYRFLDQTKKNLLNNFISTLLSNTGVTPTVVDNAFKLADRLSKLDSNKVPSDKMAEIIKSIYELQFDLSYVRRYVFNNHDSIIVNTKTTALDLFNKIKETVELNQYFGEVNIDMMKSYSLNPGINKAVLMFKENIAIVYYYVVDAKLQNDRFVLADNYSRTDNYFVFKQNSNKILSPFNEKANDLLKTSFNIIDTETLTCIRLGLDLNTYDFSKIKLDTTKPGLNTTILPIETENFGKFYMPFTYFVYDGSKIITDISFRQFEPFIIKGSTDKVIGTFEIVYNLGISIINRGGNDYLDIYNRDFDSINVNINEVKGIDVNKVGNQKGYALYNNEKYEFTLDVIEESDLNKIKDFKVEYKNVTYKPQIDKKDLYINVITYSNEFYLNYEEFMNKFKELYTLNIKAPTPLVEGENKVIFELINNNGVVEQTQNLVVTYKPINNQIFGFDVILSSRDHRFSFNKAPSIDQVKNQVERIILLLEYDKIEITFDEFINVYNGKVTFDKNQKTVLFTINDQENGFEYIIENLANLKVHLTNDFNFEFTPDIPHFIKYIDYMSYEQDGKLIEVYDEKQIHDLIIYDSVNVDFTTNTVTYHFKSLTYTHKFTAPKEGYSLEVLFITGNYNVTLPVVPTDKTIGNYISKIIIESKEEGKTEYNYENFIKNGGTFEINDKDFVIIAKFSKYDLVCSTKFNIDPNMNMGRVDVKIKNDSFALKNQPNFETDILPHISEVNIQNYNDYVNLNTQELILDYYKKGELIVTTDFSTNTINFSVKNPLVKPFALSFFDLNDNVNVSRLEVFSNTNRNDYNNYLEYFTFGQVNEKEILGSIKAIAFEYDRYKYYINDEKIITELINEKAKLVKEIDPYANKQNYFVELLGGKTRVNVVSIDKNEIKNYSIDPNIDKIPEFIYKELTQEQFISLISPYCNFEMKNGTMESIYKELFTKYFINDLEVTIDPKTNKFNIMFKDSVLSKTLYKEPWNPIQLVLDKDITEGDYKSRITNDSFYNIDEFNVEDIFSYPQISYEYYYDNCKYSFYFDDNFVKENIKILTVPFKVGANDIYYEFLTLRQYLRVNLYDDESRDKIFKFNIESSLLVDNLNPTLDELLDKITSFEILKMNGNNIFFKYEYDKLPFKEKLAKFGVTYELKNTVDTEIGKDFTVFFKYKEIGSNHVFHAATMDKLTNVRLDREYLDFSIDLQDMPKGFFITFDNYKDYLNDNVKFKKEYLYGVKDERFTIEYKGEKLVNFIESFKYKYILNESWNNNVLNTQLRFANNTQDIYVASFNINYKENFYEQDPTIEFDLVRNSEGNIMFDYYADHRGFTERIKSITVTDKYGQKQVFKNELIDFIIYKAHFDIKFTNDAVTVEAGYTENNTRVFWSDKYVLNPNPVFTPNDVLINDYTRNVLSLKEPTLDELIPFIKELRLSDRFDHEKFITGKEKDEFIKKHFTLKYEYGHYHFVVDLNPNDEYTFEKDVPFTILPGEKFEQLTICVQTRFFPEIMAKRFTDKEIIASVLSGFILKRDASSEDFYSIDDTSFNLLLDNLSLKKDANGMKILYNGEEVPMQARTQSGSGNIDYIKNVKKVNGDYLDVAGKKHYFCIEDSIVDGSFDKLYDSLDYMILNASVINPITLVDESIKLNLLPSVLKQFLKLNSFEPLANGYNFFEYEFFGITGKCNLNLYYRNDAKLPSSVNSYRSSILADDFNNVNYIDLSYFEIDFYDGTHTRFINGYNPLISISVLSVEKESYPDNGYEIHTVKYNINGKEFVTKYEVRKYISEFDFNLSRINFDEKVHVKQNVKINDKNFTLTESNLYDYITHSNLLLTYSIGKGDYYRVVDASTWLKANAKINYIHDGWGANPPFKAWDVNLTIKNISIIINIIVEM